MSFFKNQYKNCINLSAFWTKINNMPAKRLAAFDFDQTIVHDNTDTVVRALISSKQIPTEIQNLANVDWTRYMAEIFSLLHKANKNEETIRKTIREMIEVPGMVKCLKTLHKLNFELIIISDSNSEFINEWISFHGLSDTFTKIFTNYGHFDSTGLLKIEPFHYQTECTISAPNLCKGKVLENFIQEQEHRYENVFYVGDGTNDICPTLRLSQDDFGCIRINYSMDKRLAKNSNIKVKAKLLKWANGFDLLGKILQSIDSK